MSNNYGLGYLRATKYKNDTEAEYANYLHLLYKAGEIKWYEYEGIKLKLGDGAWYTPDFFVMRADDVLECHEVKGFWREAARVRIKTASSNKPFLFKAIKKVKGGWEEEYF